MLICLLKNYKLSDDIAFRFSDKGWAEWPLTAPKFAHWLHQVAGNGETINLFMDYETFGEHQWPETGIFEFLKQMPEEILKHPDFNSLTPSEVVNRYEARDEYDVHQLSSWADMERDLSSGRIFSFRKKRHGVLRGGRSNAFTSCSNFSLCEPSQNGLLAEPPQRHSDTMVRPWSPKIFPCISTISKSPSTFSGPLLLTLIFVFSMVEM